MPGAKSQKNRFLLVYGSATGQAQAIAEEIAEKSSNFGLFADLHSLEETGKRFNIENEKCVVIVTSTTGDGDPPANAEKFMRRIKKRTLGRDYLSHLHYAMLGLGDSNYSNFCRCPRDMESRLEALGAQRFYPTGLADDGVGLEVVADPWLEGLYPAVQQFLGVSGTADEGSLTETVASLSLSDNDVTDSLVNLAEQESSIIMNGTKTTVISEVTKLTQNSESQTNNSRVSVDPMKDGQIDSNTNNADTSVSPAQQVSVLTSSDTSANHNNSASSEGTTDRNIINSALSSQSTTETVSQPDSLQPSASSTNSISSDSHVNGNSNESGCNLDSSSSAGDRHVQSTPSSAHHYRETPCVPILAEDNAMTSLSLTHLQPSLSEKPLTIPVLPPPFLSISFSTDPVETASLSHQNDCKLPCAASEVHHAQISSAIVLTAPDAVKKTLLLSLNLDGWDMKYSPGDSISIICPNNTSEVNLLLDRLDIRDRADKSATLSVIPDTKKRRAAIPPHVHTTSTLRHIFTTCLNIREPPSKAFIRALLEHTSDPNEVRRMQELCSKEGVQEYTHYIRELHVSLLDFLYAFPSCKPPVERVIEHLPRLQPRPYSACSCQETSPSNLDIVFNVVEISADKGHGHYYHRRGVCTGWLDDITSSLQTGNKKDKIMVPVFLRTNQHFRPPEDISKPVIMLGPGTGVAPFIGFLQSRALKKTELKEEIYGGTWLFYGCRNKEKDYLFREELQQFETDGTLAKLCVTFSRDQPEDDTVSPRYVQDMMGQLSLEICQLLTESEVLIYVCGDAKNMAKDVNAAFEEILQKEKGMTQDDAHMFMMKKRIHKTYFEDVWV